MKFWRLNFVLALAIIFCSPQGPHVSSLEAASLRSCAASLALSAACLFGSACAPVHKVSASHQQAKSQALSEISRELSQHFRNRDYHWILHIDFYPNDFGYLKNLKATDVAHQRTSVYSELQKAGAPWRPIQMRQSITLPPEIAPFQYYRGHSSKHFLGSFRFRHNSANQAIASLDFLFENPRANLEKTFLIVSGGSHGASSVDAFARILDEKWGKKIEVVVVSDAIAQPGPFPHFRLSHVNQEGININFFQRDDFLAGAPLWNFKNYKVENSSHVRAAELAGVFVSSLLVKIDPAYRLPRVQSQAVNLVKPPPAGKQAAEDQFAPYFVADEVPHPLLVLGMAAGGLAVTGAVLIFLKKSP